MSVCTEDFTVVEEMTAITEPAGRRDETYYWADNVTFEVEEILFRVSPYPFVLGSEYFVEKYGLLSDEHRSGAEGMVHLEGVTAAQFRVFLKFLFPVHITSTTSTFTKEEWLNILTLSTLWYFHDARKLAIQHLDGQLTDLELILVGRAAYVPRWVLAGYRAIVERPKLYTLTEDLGDAIGHREVNRLWAIRYHCAVLAYDGNFVGDVLREKFEEELAGLAARELDHRTKEEAESEKREAEQRLLRETEEEARKAEADELDGAASEARNISKEQRQISESADIKEPEADAATKVEPAAELTGVESTAPLFEPDSIPKPPTFQDVAKQIAAGSHSQAREGDQMDGAADMPVCLGMKSKMERKAKRVAAKKAQAAAAAEDAKAESAMKAEAEDVKKAQEEIGKALKSVEQAEEHYRPEEEDGKKNEFEELDDNKLFITLSPLVSNHSSRPASPSQESSQCTNLGWGSSTAARRGLLWGDIDAQPSRPVLMPQRASLNERLARKANQRDSTFPTHSIQPKTEGKSSVHGGFASLVKGWQ